MVKTDLLGFVRKSKSGNALNLSIASKAFDDAQRYTSKDGQEYVSMIINLANLRQIIDGYRNVTNVCQISD